MNCIFDGFAAWACRPKYFVDLVSLNIKVEKMVHFLQGTNLYSVCSLHENT